MKNRIEFANQLDKMGFSYQNGQGLLVMCEHIHMICTGAAEQSMDECIQDELNALHFALDNWDLPESAYDIAVKNLILATIDEGMKYVSQ